MYTAILLSLIVQRAIAAATWPVQSFVTESFHPPRLAVNRTGPTADGYLLFAADMEDTGKVSNEPLLMTDRGDLVWQSERPDPDGAQIFNVDIQQLDGKSYLTYFNGTAPGNHAYGAIYVLDDAYEQAYRLCLKPGYVALSQPNLSVECYGDQHESQFTDRGTILQTVYNVTRADLTSVGGHKDGWVLESQFYEVDIKTGAIKFAWKSLDHQTKLPINLTHYPLFFNGTTGNGTGQYASFDYFHINSVTLSADGGYLISSRHFWAVIKLTKEGDVEWILPGDRVGNDFEHIDPQIHFSWQHHARVSNVTSKGMLLHIHNNANSEVSFADGTFGEVPTSGMLMELDLADPTKRTATLRRNLTDPNDILYSFAEGNYQPLPNGNVLLGHGYVPEIKEYLPNGKIALTARFGPTDFAANSYRAFRYPWVGKPNWPPKAKATNGMTGSMDLYMSWNGATEYDKWLVYTGSSKTDLTLVANVSRTGFETSIPLTGRKHGYAQAVAAHDGKALGKSAVVIF